MDVNDEFVEITRPIRVLLHPKYLRHRLRKKHSIDEQSTMSATTVEQLDIVDDEHETEWLDEAGVDEEETGHINDDDESEMETSQDEEQMEFIERRKTPDSDEDEDMSH
jgi:hypothetical protein